MKRAAILLLMLLTVGLISANCQTTISKEERKSSLNYLTETLKRVRNLTKGLSEVQLNYRSSPGKWSLKDNVEHLYNVEQLCMEKITSALEADPDPGKAGDIVDESIKKRMAVRTDSSARYKAPEPIQPKNKFGSFKKTLEAFESERKKTMVFIRKTKADLRNHFQKHPFGNMDAYQWTIFVSAHNERHILQMQEILASEEFPQ